MPKPFQFIHYYECKTSPKNITEITFDISRFSRYKDKLIFNEPVSEAEAVKAVESYLSEPITEHYFERVKDDLFHSVSILNFDELIENGFLKRGNLLTEAIFLEGIRYYNGNFSVINGCS